MGIKRMSGVRGGKSRVIAQHTKQQSLHTDCVRTVRRFVGATTQMNHHDRFSREASWWACEFLDRSPISVGCVGRKSAQRCSRGTTGL